MSRWVKLPPRDTLKLFATAVEALKRSGIEDAEKHLVLIRSWQSASLLLKRAPFSMEEISLAKKFCQERLENLVNRFI